MIKNEFLCFDFWGSVDKASPKWEFSVIKTWPQYHLFTGLWMAVACTAAFQVKAQFRSDIIIWSFHRKFYFTRMIYYLSIHVSSPSHSLFKRRCQFYIHCVPFFPIISKLEVQRQFMFPNISKTQNMELLSFLSKFLKISQNFPHKFGHKIETNTLNNESEHAYFYNKRVTYSISKICQ